MNPSPTGTRPPAITLRQSYRENGKVRKRESRNLSDWPTTHIEGLRGVLKGGTVTAADREALTVVRCLRLRPRRPAHRFRAKNRPDSMSGLVGDRCRDLVLAMISDADHRSRLKTGCRVGTRTRDRELPACIPSLGLSEVDEDELYTALDWLGERQPAIETALAKRHLKNGTLVLYDVSSSYMEGNCCSLPTAATAGTGAGVHVCKSSMALALRARRLPGRHRGVRRQYRRSEDAR